MYESKVSSEMKDPKRRNFLRKIFTLTASAGVAGLLLDRLPGRGVIQPVEASSMTIDSSNSGAGTTSLMSPGSPALTATNTGSGAALQGTCTAGTGVYGNTTTGTGVQGTASAAGGRALFGFVTDPARCHLSRRGHQDQCKSTQAEQCSQPKLDKAHQTSSMPALGIRLVSRIVLQPDI